MKIEEICKQFGIELTSKQDITTGIINKTFSVKDKDGKEYIVQECNTNVFDNIDALMCNITNVTNFLKEKIIKEGGNPERETLKVVYSQNKPYFSYIDKNKTTHYFRVYDKIKNTISYNATSAELLKKSGIAFGKFQNRLQNYPTNTIYDILPNFHNTLQRYKNLLNAFSNAKTTNSKRYCETKKYIQWFNKHKDTYVLIINALKNKTIPTRVVHNDTKLNNVLFDKTTNEPICVIDLDTIMQGSLLYDIGDAVRYGANLFEEDNEKLQAKLCLDKFKSFVSGYISQTKHTLTQKEKSLIPISCFILTAELSMRFLTDYLENDKYFVCNSKRKKHNLERAICQLNLAKDILSKQKTLKRIVDFEYEKI